MEKPNSLLHQPFLIRLQHIFSPSLLYGAVVTLTFLMCCCLWQVSKHLSERWSIVQKVSSPDQPQMNALCGQNSGLLRTAIKDVVADKQLAWDDFIDPVLSLFRTSTNPTTKFTPYCLMFNRKASMPKDVSYVYVHWILFVSWPYHTACANSVQSVWRCQIEH